MTTQEQRLAEAEEIITEGVQVYDRQRAEIKKLRDALIDILDAGDWRWSEADDAAIFVIYLSEKDFTEFSDLALAEVK